MTSTRAALLAVALLCGGCSSPAAPSVFSSVTGTWSGRYEQASCALPIDSRPCAFNRLGTVELTLVQRGHDVEGRVEFWSDQGESTVPLIGLSVTGTFAGATLALAGSAPIPTPAGAIERMLHDWETQIDPDTGRMHGRAAWTVIDPQPPIAGAGTVSSRTYTIDTLRRVAR